MIDQMTEQVGTDSKAFSTYLSVQSRFERYTPNNALLVAAQMPTATRLADYNAWKKQGIFVNTKKPIVILRPREFVADSGDVATTFDPVKVYDISQTAAGREPTLKHTERTLLVALVQNAPVQIVPTEGVQGAQFEPEQKVQPNMEADEIFRGLTNALAHVELSGGDIDYNQGDNAFHAYCASYMLCRKYGVNTQAFQFERAPEFFAGMDSKEIRSELSKIQRTARSISERMSAALYQQEKQKKQGKSNEER